MRHFLQSLERSKEIIAESYQRQRNALTPLSRIAPDLAEQGRAAFDAKEAENMELINRLFADEEARKEDFGRAAASRDLERSRRHAEEEALTALCAYACETMAEARMKAEYLISMPCDLQDCQVHAMLQPPQTDDQTHDEDASSARINALCPRAAAHRSRGGGRQRCMPAPCGPHPRRGDSVVRCAG